MVWFLEWQLTYFDIYCFLLWWLCFKHNDLQKRSQKRRIKSQSIIGKWQFEEICYNHNGSLLQRWSIKNLAISYNKIDFLLYRVDNESINHFLRITVDECNTDHCEITFSKVNTPNCKGRIIAPENVVSMLKFIWNLTYWSKTPPFQIVGCNIGFKFQNNSWK